MKSTLLGALLGRLPLDAGSAWLGPSVVVGEIDQARGLFLGEQSLLDAFDAASGLVPADARTPLQACGVNLLVLDEPTNRLDLPAIEQLKSALETYPGTLLLVTHDRRMLDAVPTNRHINVDQGRVTEY